MSPNSREPGESDDHKSSSARSVAPVAWPGYLWPSAAGRRWRRIPLSDLSGSGVGRGFLARALSAQKLLPSGPCGACFLPASLGLRLCFVFPDNTDIARWRSLRTCWFELTGQRGAAAHSVSVVFRQHQCACPTDANSFRLSAFYFLLGPPDSSGRGFCARFSTLSGTRSVLSGCWFKPTPGDEEAGFIKIVPVGAARLQEENR